MENIELKLSLFPLSYWSISNGMFDYTIEGYNLSNSIVSKKTIQNSIIKSLSKNFDITNKEDAIKKIDWLIKTGYRESFLDLFYAIKSFNKDLLNRYVFLLQNFKYFSKKKKFTDELLFKELLTIRFGEYGYNVYSRFIFKQKRINKQLSDLPKEDFDIVLSVQKYLENLNTKIKIEKHITQVEFLYKNKYSITNENFSVGDKLTAFMIVRNSLFLNWISKYEAREIHTLLLEDLLHLNLTIYELYKLHTDYRIVYYGNLKPYKNNILEYNFKKF